MRRKLKEEKKQEVKGLGSGGRYQARSKSWTEKEKKWEDEHVDIKKRYKRGH